MKNRNWLLLSTLLVLVAGGGWFGLAYRGSGGGMTRAGEEYLASLSGDQRAVATVPFDNAARLDWHFIPKDKRKGMQIKEMSAEQRLKAHALVKSGLSQIGYDKAATIMQLEAILHVLEKGRDGSPIRDPERYYVTVFGDPSGSSRWGWSVEGHHLSLNFVVSGGTIVSTTPTMFGANPAVVKSDVGVGPKKGTRVLAKEEELAFQLVNSLSAEQFKTALIDAKAPREIRGAGQPQPPSEPVAGIAASALSDEQSKLLWSLIEVYAGNMPEDVAAERLTAIKEAGPAKVHFAWSGAKEPGIGHYYRIEGPTFVVEFVNTQPDSAGNPANHIHSVWRNKAGDFGIEK